MPNDETAELLDAAGTPITIGSIVEVPKGTITWSEAQGSKPAGRKLHGVITNITIDPISKIANPFVAWETTGGTWRATEDLDRIRVTGFDHAFDHAPQYSQRPLGRSNIAGSAMRYGSSVRCSCGWFRKTNEPRRKVRQQFIAHLEDVRDEANRCKHLNADNTQCGRLIHDGSHHAARVLKNRVSHTLIWWNNTGVLGQPPNEFQDLEQTTVKMRPAG